MGILSHLAGESRQAGPALIGDVPRQLGSLPLNPAGGSRVRLFPRRGEMEAPDMTDPGEARAAAAGGHGRLRASRADRERVIELLKVAFVQGRLTQDELDTRVGQALASRTYADLADLTGDIPAGSPGAELAAEPAGAPARTLAKAAHRSAICLLVAFALVGVAALTGSEALVALAIYTGI